MRSASTSMPGPKQPSRSTGQRLLRGRGTRPIAAPEQAPGPGLGRRDPPDLRERAVPGLVGGPPEERVVLLAVRHVRHRPVHRDDPQPAAEHPRRPVRPRRPRHLLEQHPHRVRARASRGPRDSEEMFGCLHRRPCPGIRPSRPASSCPASRSAPRRWWYRPSASLAITCPYPQFRPRNSHSASTKYTISRAGSSRRRCSRVPVTSTTSSTSSGGNALVSTPIEIRSGSHPSGDRPSEPS